MNRTQLWKKMLIGMMAFSMVAGGASSAFAKDKHDSDRRWEWSKNHDDDDRDDRDDRDWDDDKVHIQMKGKTKIHLHFHDVEDDAAWALKFIAELAAKGVFNGYEDGSFRPNQHIPRIEALTAAVRLMGLEAQAKSQAEMSTELNFEDAEKIERKYPWSVGYVAVAAENDLFAETDKEVHPEQKASRLWATMLLVKALKLEGEAKANMNAKLTFKDAKAIPAGAVGYVKVALDRNLITGYENNTFQPNKPVTRAEMAALLGRTDEQMPQNPGQVSGEFTGTVASVQNNTISITNNGTATSYNVASDVIVIRNGQLVGLSSVLPGDQVKVHTFNGIVNFIAVNQAVNVTTVTGKYKSHRLNTEGKLDLISVSQEVYGQNPQTVILNVANNAEITGGTIANFVADQTQLELTLTNQAVTKIAIK